MHRRRVTRRAAAPVAVVGGGTAGALAVLHLRRSGIERVVLVDPGPLHGGAAYASAAGHHLLNVRAAQMSALPDEPEDFLHWLRSNGVDAAPACFAPRRRFAEYLTARVAEAGPPEQLRDRVCGLTPTPTGIELTTAGGHRLTVAAVVLALGPPTTRAPGCASDLAGGAPLVQDPWQPGVLDRVADRCSRNAGGRVLLLGTGLTMADVTLSLARANPSLALHASSRHRLLPRAHREVPTAVRPAPVLPAGPLRLDELRALVADSVRGARAGTGDWRPGIDRLRPVTDALWRKLSPADQRAACGADARRWDTLRHRVAPAVGAELARLLATGRLEVRPLEQLHDDYDLVVNCTGFGSRCTDEPLVAGLVRQGLARVHPLGVGLVVDGSGAPLTAAGRPLADVTVLGALRRGEFWETTAVPELRQQAADAARAIAASLDGHRQVAATTDAAHLTRL
jgi:uncharacterized NAD(P)/FAD-binding protein YdhS